MTSTTSLVLRAIKRFAPSSNKIKRFPLQPLTRAQMAKFKQNHIQDLRQELNLAHPPSNQQLKAHYTNLAAISALLTGVKDNPPPLPSELERAELNDLATTRHPLSRYQKLWMAGDLSMERLLAILRNPHLKFQSVIDAMAVRHRIRASYVVTKLTKLPSPDLALLDKWIARVPRPYGTILRATGDANPDLFLLDDTPVPLCLTMRGFDFFNEQLCMDLAAHMSYTLKTRTIWEGYQVWLTWKRRLSKSSQRIDFNKYHKDHTDILFIPTILLLREATHPRAPREILTYILNGVRLPPQSPQTRDIFQRLLEESMWMSHPQVVAAVLFSAAVYRPSLQFAEYVQLVIAQLLKSPEKLRKDAHARNNVKKLLTWALEDCGAPGPPAQFEISTPVKREWYRGKPQIVHEFNQTRLAKGQIVEGEGFFMGLDMEQWCPSYE